MANIARSGSRTASSDVTRNRSGLDNKSRRAGLAPSAACNAASRVFTLRSWREHLSDYLLSVLLGIVEGLTEFLPVSSTAHLRIAEQLMHVPLSSGYWKMYSIVIQLGAILSPPIYFRPHIAKLVSTFPERENKDLHHLTPPSRRAMIASVV